MERPTTQSPLQLQAFCAVQLLSLTGGGGEGWKTKAVRYKTLVVDQYSRGGRGIKAETEGLGQNEETQTTVSQGCRQGRESCVGKRGFGRDRIEWVFPRETCRTSNMMDDVPSFPQVLTSSVYKDHDSYALMTFVEVGKS